MFGMYCAYILFLAFNRQILGEYDHLAEKLQAKTIEALEAGTLKMLAAAAAAEASSWSSASSGAGPGAKGVTAAHSPTAVLVGSGAGDPEWSTSALRQHTSSSSGGGKHGGLAAMGGGGLPGLQVTPTQSPRHLSEISSTMGKLLFALFLLPWKVAFSWTVPDVTDPRYSKHHMVAFLLSICWIGAKSIHLSAPSCPPACHPLHLAVRRVHTVTGAKLHLPSPHLSSPHGGVGRRSAVLLHGDVVYGRGTDAAYQSLRHGLHYPRRWHLCACCLTC
jgi:hypothetical protein